MLRQQGCEAVERAGCDIEIRGRLPAVHGDIPAGCRAAAGKIDDKAVRADLALVVDKLQSEKRYRAHTVLTLSMAYKNARLIARPYSDWLGSEPDALQIPTEV